MCRGGRRGAHGSCWRRAGGQFDLKSESEQRALLDVMAELRSYLPGPLQILVRSRGV